MSVYKRSDWNDLLDSVNNVLQNPPEDGDCEPIDPIPHVGLKHRWSKDDIREVQDKLRQTCEDITFDEIPELWKQSIIDDINEALGEAWCDCECENPTEEDGTEIELRTLTPRVRSNCQGDPPDAVDTVCSVINGMQIGKSGVKDRQWRVIRRFSTGTSSVIASGSIDCDGVVVCTGSAIMIQEGGYGVYVECFDCNLPECGTALADAATTVAGMPTLTYVLRILASSASCCD